MPTTSDDATMTHDTPTTIPLDRVVTTTTMDTIPTMMDDMPMTLRLDATPTTL